MDVDSWASRVHAAKSLSAVHAARMHYGGEEDTRENEKQNQHEEGGNEVVEQEFADLSLGEEILRIQRMLQSMQLSEVLGNRSSQSRQEGEETSEFDNSSVIVHDLEDDCLEPTRSKAENHFVLDDSEGDDDAKSCFPCPFCYVDIEVLMLCNHLEEEHCFNFKNSVCPLCAENLGKDLVGHFMVQHASSFKHRRRSQKSGPWSGSSAMKALLKNGRGYAHESAPDPLLSPFICNVSFSDPNGIRQDACSDINVSIISDTRSAEPSSLDEGCEKDNEERRQRATFVQQLIASTIFSDL